MTNGDPLDTTQVQFEHEVTYIDPAALLTRQDLAQDHDIENLPAYNKIKQGLEDVNNLFDSRQVFIPICAQELILQLQTLAYKESYLSMKANFTGDPFIRQKGHHHDSAHAFRYLVASLSRYWGIPETGGQPLGTQS
jgi:hypothetical protein